MALAVDVHIGATHIRIWDDCCCSKEKVPEILDKIGHQAYRDLYAAKIREEQKNEGTA